jgi:hypothetical protein
MALENDDKATLSVAVLTYPTVPKPTTLDVSWLVRNDVLTRVSRFCVEIKFKRLGVETRLRRFGTEMNRWIVEANS